MPMNSQLLLVPVAAMCISLEAQLERYSDMRDDCLLFEEGYPEIQYNSVRVRTQQNQPPLHGCQVTLFNHATGVYPDADPLPMPSIFNWHYLQCVIKCFGTPQYKNLPNIRFIVFPFRTASDSDGSGGDHSDNTNSPYLSYPSEQYLANLSEKCQVQESQRKVQQWIFGVSQVFI
jgi:hypothetical protein